MASEVEALGKELFDKSVEAALNGVRIGGKAFSSTLSALNVGAKVGGKTIRGICLILDKGAEFTTKNVMKAVRDLAYNKTGNIEFSNQNIDMVRLQQSGKVSKIEENLTAGVMKHFNEQCKKYGVKYSAMKDERDPNNPSYMIFYNGKSAEIILHVMKEAYKDFVEEQKQANKTAQKQELTDKKDPFIGKKERESVMAKLAFFRDRVADRERERDALEKNVRHTDRQR